MPARQDPGSKRVTRLAAVRHWRRATQQEMAERIGIGLNTYRRLELGLARDPGLNTLMRCAKALGVPLGAVVDPGWLDWGGEDGVLPEPPPGGFWSGNERAGERPSWVPEPEVDWEAWKE